MKLDRGQNVRLVVSLLRFIISVRRHFYSSRRFLGSTRRNASSFRRFTKSTRRFLSSTRRLVCSTRRLTSSTRRFRIVGRFLAIAACGDENATRGETESNLNHEGSARGRVDNLCSSKTFLLCDVTVFALQCIHYTKILLKSERRSVFDTIIHR